MLPTGRTRKAVIVNISVVYLRYIEDMTHIPALTSAGACNMLATQQDWLCVIMQTKLEDVMREEVYQWKGHLFLGEKKVAMLLFIYSADLYEHN